MTTDEARRWLIIASLGITGIQAVFLVIGPAIGLPLEYPKNLDLLQVVTPVFLGYLGSAAHFIFKTPSPSVPANNQFLGLMVKGPIIIYALVVVAAFGAFWYSNRPGTEIGAGMSPDNLGSALSIALGVLAVTTGVISAYLFAANQQPAPPAPNPQP